MAGRPSPFRRNLLANVRRHAADQVQVQVRPTEGGGVVVDDDKPGEPEDQGMPCSVRFTLRLPATVDG